MPLDRGDLTDDEDDEEEEDDEDAESEYDEETGEKIVKSSKKNKRTLLDGGYDMQNRKNSGSEKEDEKEEMRREVKRQCDTYGCCTCCESNGRTRGAGRRRMGRTSDPRPGAAHPADRCCVSWPVPATGNVQVAGAGGPADPGGGERGRRVLQRARCGACGRDA